MYLTVMVAVFNFEYFFNSNKPYKGNNPEVDLTIGMSDLLYSMCQMSFKVNSNFSLQEFDEFAALVVIVIEANAR